METLITVKTIAELQKLQDYLADKEYIAYDTETTGLDDDSEIIGFSVCAEPDVGYYVVLAYWDVESKSLKYLETNSYAKDFLKHMAYGKLIMHNGIFDCRMTMNNFDVSLIESLFHDTMISGHLLNENRPNGLKERAAALYGDDAKKEQAAMKASISKNGGALTKANYELYKADCDLIAHYGAKDAILTLKLFYEDVPELFAQGLYEFFYVDESMPLLKGPTYDLNTTGLRIDSAALQKLRGELETECLEIKAFILNEIAVHVKDLYPGTNKKNTFNIGSSKQLAWLLYFKLDEDIDKLTPKGREIFQAAGLKAPYSVADKRRAKAQLKSWAEAKMEIPGVASIKDPWNYVACDKESLEKLKGKYKWVKALLDYSKALKLLNTYVIGIQERTKYGVIRPGFLQHGTTSGRYSSRNPNFQNLPRKDKRIKSCIISRPGNVFVGADYAQLEPRVFASLSGDIRLIEGFKSDDDFYSIIGVEVFDKKDCSLKKDAPDSFATKYPHLRDIAKVVALSATYGTTAPKMAPAIKKSVTEAQNVIDSYFDKFPTVKEFMEDCHNKAKDLGFVTNLFGRPRRMPEAKEIIEIYGDTEHAKLPYNIRNILNLAVNHTVQSTGASIMNRAAIKCWQTCQVAALEVEPKWAEVRIVMQVHDELILEGPEELAEEMVVVLKESMEKAVELPNVALLAEPKIGKNLAELK